VLKNHFGVGKSWKNIPENYAFFIGSNGKQENKQQRYITQFALTVV